MQHSQPDIGLKTSLILPVGLAEGTSRHQSEAEIDFSSLRFETARSDRIGVNCDLRGDSSHPQLAFASMTHTRLTDSNDRPTCKGRYYSTVHQYSTVRHRYCS
jgi:hypothetical protein